MNLNQVTISVSNVAASIAFYELLGLKLIVHAPHYARFECPRGDATFSLHQSDSTGSPANVWIYFEVEDVDNTVAALERKGVNIEEAPTDRPWLWREARLKDPDGNLLIIYHAGANRKYPPWRV